MPFVAEVGDAVQTRGEVDIEWRIRDFFSLSDKVNDFYRSPVFSFADARWYLKMFPNGLTKHSSEKWIYLYLTRKDFGPRRTVRYTLGIKCSDGVEKELKENEKTFSERGKGYGSSRFCSRSELQNQVSGLMPNNVLTITCHLKCTDTNVARVSLSNRVCEVSSNMKTILADGKRADFTLKLGDREWPVHKLILESRCEYFADMFRHEWVEKTVGVVTFSDMEKHALDSVLDFVYSGLVEDMSAENVCDIYVAAHKFLLDDLKALCIEWMKENMCVEIMCKSLVIADTYEEGDLNESATEYFVLESEKIFDTEEWKELKKNNSSLVAEVLEETTRRLKKKQTK